MGGFVGSQKALDTFFFTRSKHKIHSIMWLILNMNQLDVSQEVSQKEGKKEGRSLVKGHWQ